jgi:molybdopterin-guanine dinucleotide biosynthesis protein A
VRAQGPQDFGPRSSVLGPHRIQPFPGLYRSAAAEKLKPRLTRGISVYALLEALTVQPVALPDAAWAKDALRNINTWDDARALGIE